MPVASPPPSPTDRHSHGRRPRPLGDPESGEWAVSTPQAELKKAAVAGREQRGVCVGGLGWVCQAACGAFVLVPAAPGGVYFSGGGAPFPRLRSCTVGERGCQEPWWSRADSLSELSRIITKKTVKVALLAPNILRPGQNRPSSLLPRPLSGCTEEDGSLEPFAWGGLSL